MLTIRDAQIRLIEEARRPADLAAMVSHLARHFPKVASGLDRATLDGRVAATLEDAAGYGLVSPRDRARYLNLAAVYGWGFDREPDHAWLRAYLLDPDNGAPSERLAAVVRECLARIAIAAERRRLFAKHRRGTRA